MYMDAFFDTALTETIHLLTEPSAYRSVLILIGAIIAAFILSKFLAKGIIFIAQKVALRSQSVSGETEAVKLRQVETYLSITIAIVRAAVVAVVAYLTWRILSPVSSSGAAAIGASAFFIVFAGQTLGTILRDITAGVIMITEGWFHVGDYIKIEPFLDLAGVVERFTLRSTKIRNLSGEVIWVHNQQIQAVHVIPDSVRRLEVDLFTRDIETAKAAVEDIIATLPASAALVPNPVKIKAIEEWGGGTWRIIVAAKTAPGREWLIERYFVGAIEEVDEDKERKADHVFLYDPIYRHADPVAEKKFKRAMRVQQ